MGRAVKAWGETSDSYSFHVIHTPASSTSTMSSTSPRKKPEVWVSNELRNTNWPKFTEWIKGNTTAQDDEKIRGVFNAGKSLFKELSSDFWAAGPGQSTGGARLGPTDGLDEDRT